MGRRAHVHLHKIAPASPTAPTRSANLHPWTTSICQARQSRGLHLGRHGGGVEAVGEKLLDPGFADDYLSRCREAGKRMESHYSGFKAMNVTAATNEELYEQVRALTEHIRELGTLFVATQPAARTRWKNPFAKRPMPHSAQRPTPHLPRWSNPSMKTSSDAKRPDFSALCHRTRIRTPPRAHAENTRGCSTRRTTRPRLYDFARAAPKRKKDPRTQRSRPSPAQTRTGPSFRPIGRCDGRALPFVTTPCLGAAGTQSPLGRCGLPFPSVVPANREAPRSAAFGFGVCVCVGGLPSCVASR